MKIKIYQNRNRKRRWTLYGVFFIILGAFPLMAILREEFTKSRLIFGIAFFCFILIGVFIFYKTNIKTIECERYEVIDEEETVCHQSGIQKLSQL